MDKSMPRIDIERLLGMLTDEGHPSVLEGELHVQLAVPHLGDAAGDVAVPHLLLVRGRHPDDDVVDLLPVWRRHRIPVISPDKRQCSSPPRTRRR
ncbi:MAG: hypothetical protein WC483_03870 [Candidatus Paceibacterota bacterium]